MVIRQYTITFPVKPSTQEILLGMKKQGFGIGKWNGFGGKVEPKESPESGAIRELREESGLEAGEVHFAGELTYIFGEDQSKWQHIYLYICENYSCQPRESNEMLPEWFSFETIPYQQMWPSFNEWLPQILTGKTVSGTVYFDKQDNFIKSEINFEL